MAFQIIEEDEALPEKNLVIVLYGAPGASKTSLSYTAENPFLLDFDNGAHRAKGRKATLKLTSWADIQEFMKTGELGRREVKTLINDTGGALLDDFIASHVMKQSTKFSRAGGLSQQGFGAMKDVFNQYVKEGQDLGCDLVFICHGSEKADGDNMVLRPKMTGGSYDILMAKADLVGYVYMENNRRWLNFNPTDRHVGKNCAGFAPIELPHYEDAAWPTFFAKLIRYAKDQINAMSTAQVEAMEKVKALSSEIAGASTEAQLLKVYEDTAALSNVYRAQVLPALTAKLDDIWLTEYIEPATEPQQLNVLITEAIKLPAPLQTVKKVLVASAKAKGFTLTGGKENPHFVRAESAGPNAVPAPEVKGQTPKKTPEMPAKETAATAPGSLFSQNPR